MPWFLTWLGGHMTILHPLDSKYCMQFYSADSASNFKKECIPVGCILPALHCAGGRGSLSREGVSVQGSLSRGLCPGYSLSRGSLSRGSLSRCLCPGGSLSGGLCPGGLCQWGSLSGRPYPPVNRMTHRS